MSFDFNYSAFRPIHFQTLTEENIRNFTVELIHPFNRSSTTKAGATARFFRYPYLILRLMNVYWILTPLPGWILSCCWSASVKRTLGVVSGMSCWCLKSTSWLRALSTSECDLLYAFSARIQKLYFLSPNINLLNSSWISDFLVNLI